MWGVYQALPQFPLRHIHRRQIQPELERTMGGEGSLSSKDRAHMPQSEFDHTQRWIPSVKVSNPLEFLLGVLVGMVMWTP